MLMTNTERKKPKNYWKDINNCRASMDEYARSRGLDPLNPETWYWLPIEGIKVQQPKLGKIYSLGILY